MGIQVIGWPQKLKNVMNDIFDSSFIAGEKPVYIIAELGSNHNGSIELAKEHIDVAFNSGCTAIKFQLPFANEAYPPKTKFGDLYGDVYIDELIRKNEIGLDFLNEMNDYAHNLGLETGCSGDGFIALEMMQKLKFDFYKIPSFTISHLPLLKEMDQLGVPVILSTGRHTLGQIDEAVRSLPKNLKGILHCISAYPCPEDQLNLFTIPFLKQAFAQTIGFSDHSLDATRAPGLAVALGAKIIEKHFTLDRTLNGPDHFFALQPDELKAMVDEIRKIENDSNYAEQVLNSPGNEILLGNPKNGLVQAEEAFYTRTRLGIYFTESLPAGSILNKKNLQVFRCADTEPVLHPRYLGLLVGSKLVKNVEAFTPSTWEDVIQYVI
jgi:N,N'-diacetyllegionaminate synthase